jgi:hypothetical protein
MRYRYTGIAIKWFDKLNGNTYHSVRVINNETGEMLFCPFQYGYGEQYRQTALKAMSEAGWLPSKYRAVDGEAKYLCYERKTGYPILWTVSDRLKRECVANGSSD